MPPARSRRPRVQAARRHEAWCSAGLQHSSYAVGGRGLLGLGFDTAAAGRTDAVERVEDGLPAPRLSACALSSAM